MYESFNVCERAGFLSYCGKLKVVHIYYAKKEKTWCMCVYKDINNSIPSRTGISLITIAYNINYR